MKILHVSGARSWGGNEQQLINLIPELENLGASNIVFGVQGTRLQQECIQIHAKFISAKGKKINTFSNYKFLKKIVLEQQPDIIHLHTSDSLTVFTVADLLFNLNTTAVFSKKGMGASGSFLSKFKYNYKNINSIFCVSNRVKADFSKILSTNNLPKVHVIHDCVNLDIVSHEPVLNLRGKYEIGDRKIIGNIANHTAAKDLPVLIEAVHELVITHNRSDFRLVQIGEFSKLTPSLQQLIVEKNLQEYIILTDKLERAYSLNPQFDVFVMSSQREGGPSSVLESMLYGTTVISTNVGVIPDVIQHQQNGFIVAVKDAKSIAETINYVLDHPQNKQAIGQKASATITENFSAKKIATQTFETYQKLLGL